MLLAAVVRLAAVAHAAPRPEVLELARTAYRCAVAAHAIDDTGILAVIDFELPSSARRLAIVDLRTGAVLREVRVTHGRGSGGDHATSFSNVEGSHQSSVGVYRTAGAYVGTHGRAVLLDGLDPGWNDGARAREIVLHRAAYASDAFLERWGRLGRSHGCPALDPAVADAIIDLVDQGTLIFAYAPVQDWLRSSEWLSCG